MGLNVELQDERGHIIEQLLDPKNLLPSVLKRAIPDVPLLVEIDWYGDTTFNGKQMPRFLSEWEAAAKHCKSSDEADLVGKVKSLAVRCKDGMHLYLKFIGD